MFQSYGRDKSSKGSVRGQITTWKKGAPDDTIASSAAKQVTAKLP
ncbi:MAG: hypothetical protein ACXWCY_15415 [Burkholderiales bacterium]